MGDVRIRHPKSGAHVTSTFAAYGRDDPRTKWIRGELLNGPFLVSEGTTIEEPPNWIILFESVPITGGGGSYTLQVRDGDGTVVRLTQIQVVVRGLGILYPTPNDPVCTDFVAYGQTDNTTNVTGTMTAGANVINGTTIQQPDAQGTWVIQFLGVPDGNAYRLDVTNTAGQAGLQTPITVNTGYCTSS